MSVPGSRGVRLHVASEHLQHPSTPRAASVTYPTLALAVASPKHSVQTFVLHPGYHAQSAHDSGAEFLRAVASAEGGSLGVELRVRCGRAREELESIAKILQAKLALRVVLEHCFSTKEGGDPDNNLLRKSLETDVGALADLDVPVIAVSDCLARATEESLREAVEDAFYVDCAGETVRERLSLHLMGPGRAGLVKHALGFGVTRFDCAADGLEALARLCAKEK